jgi:hypothetical protein
MTNKRYRLMDLEDVAAGMTLSEAVLDGRGGMLLPSATVLTDAMLTSLRRRGIDTVFLVNDDVSEADLQAERERLQKRLARLFRKCKGNSASTELMQCITTYRLGEAE